MYYTLLIIQYISIFGLLFESYIVFVRWKNQLHSFLFLSCVATLISNAGYLMEMLSSSKEAYLQGLQLSYLGKVWIPFSLFLFAMRLCKIRIKKAILFFLSLIHVAVFLSVLTTKWQSLYYINIEYKEDGLFPYLTYKSGIFHHFYTGLLVFYIVFGLIAMFRAVKKETNQTEKNRFIFIVLAWVTESAFFFLYMLRIIRGYDVTVLGYTIGLVFMYIAIFKYNLMDTKELAKDYLVDELSEGIIAVDETGKVIYFNHPAQELFPELLDNPEDVVGKIQPVIEKKEMMYIEDRIYLPEKNILYDDKVKVGEIYVLTDDTEHVQYMEDLKEQKEIADHANQAKSFFLANMSHEIRTPINAVIGMDEMILRESMEKETLSYAADIMSAGKTLLSLINDILDFSKIEEGKMEIVPVQYEPSQLINDLVNLIKNRAVKKGLQFEVNADGDIPSSLCGDEIRIRQCALNILTNAVKYTEKGSIKLEVGFQKEDEKRIRLQFCISDTGIGIKEEDMEKLFSPFTRIEEKRNRSIEGTGLGMSITRQLLDLMGSSLEVHSVYGEGSEFSFSVLQKVANWSPIGNDWKRLEEERFQKVYQELFHAPNARILVVDDTEVNLMVIKNLLKKTQINIDTAASGKEALQRTQIKQYDVIFVDHMMPDMDGIETLQHFKEQELEGTVFIALTANAISGARKMYLDAGFSDYLSKPVDGKRLERMLKHYLPQEKVEILERTEQKGIVPEKDTVLIIDDDETVCKLAENILKSLYQTEVCFSGKEAIRAAGEKKPDLILLDIHMPDMSGFEVMQELKEREDTKKIPILLVTGDDDTEMEANGLLNGASDFIRKPFAPEILLPRAKRIIDLSHYQTAIEKEADHQTLRADRLTREMMISLSKAVDTKDHYTDGHSRRVAAYSAEIARRLGKSPEEQEKIYEIGLLHDIGKIGIHEDIIHKSTRLTDEEFMEIKEHTIKGYEILKEIVDMPELADGARWHHERFDGRGYPDGLKGEEIPETARIVCVADCYDAMTSTRTYSVPKSQETVRAEIERCIGAQFDEAPARAMLQMIDEDKDFRMNERTDGSDIWEGFDRVWDFVKKPMGETQEKQQETPAGQTALPEWLCEIPELDIKEGIKNCGEEEGYLSILSVFHRTAEKKIHEIEQYYENGEWKDYTRCVHGLKSSARIIGAIELSELAKKLETAGKKEDTDFIQKNTNQLLEMYRKLNTLIR